MENRTPGTATWPQPLLVPRPGSPPAEINAAPQPPADYLTQFFERKYRLCRARIVAEANSSHSLPRVQEIHRIAPHSPSSRLPALYQIHRRIRTGHRRAPYERIHYSPIPASPGRLPAAYPAAASVSTVKAMPTRGHQVAHSEQGRVGMDRTQAPERHTHGSKSPPPNLYAKTRPIPRCNISPNNVAFTALFYERPLAPVRRSSRSASSIRDLTGVVLLRDYSAPSSSFAPIQSLVVLSWGGTETVLPHRSCPSPSPSSISPLKTLARQNLPQMDLAHPNLLRYPPRTIKLCFRSIEIRSPHSANGKHTSCSSSGEMSSAASPR